MWKNRLLHRYTPRLLVLNKFLEWLCSRCHNDLVRSEYNDIGLTT